MTIPHCTVRQYAGHTNNVPADSLSLTYEDRFLRRKILTCESGEQILIDLAQTTSLDHGGVLILDNGREVEILAAPEVLLEVTAPDLARIAWHIGNRHTPCQIEKGRLLIQTDHVIRNMLLKIGASVREVREPFTPEGGAYGHGKTHGHSH